MGFSAVAVWPGASWDLLGPAVIEDDLDEIVTDERVVEVFEHIGINVAERAVRTVLVAIGEGLQDSAFETRAWMGCGDGFKRLGGQITQSWHFLEHNLTPNRCTPR